jgi:hypothetical protein
VQKKKREQMRRKFSLKFDPSTNKDATDGLIHREGINTHSGRHRWSTIRCAEGTSKLIGFSWTFGIGTS